MSHECEGCGEWCYCDIDDMPMPQPNDCRHTCGPEADDDPDGDLPEWDDDEEAADRERYEIETGIGPYKP